MRLPRYPARTAGFATLYLLTAYAGALTMPAGGRVALFWPAAVVAAVWLVAQAGFGRRSLDLVALTTAAMVYVSLEGGTLLVAVAAAVTTVLPAALFAWLLERLLPGFWLAHGDRFRRFGPAVARLAGVAAAAGAAGAVLTGVTFLGDLSAVDMGYLLLRDTSALVLTVLAIRTVRLPASPSHPHRDAAAGSKSGRAHLTLVR